MSWSAATERNSSKDPAIDRGFLPHLKATAVGKDSQTGASPKSSDGSVTVPKFTVAPSGPTTGGDDPAGSSAVTVLVSLLTVALLAPPQVVKVQPEAQQCQGRS